jgi:hypothetical protein
MERNFESAAQKEILNKDKVQQDYLKLCREKEQISSEYDLRLEQIQQNLKVLDKKHIDVRQYIIMMKQERDEIKNKLFREQIRFENCAS